MGRSLYTRTMRLRKLAVIALLSLGAIPPEEADLFARSLRNEGRAELEGNLAPIDQLPISEVQAELDPRTARVDGQLRLVVRNREATPWYEGQSLLKLLEGIHIASDRNLIDARLPVQYVIRPQQADFHDFRGYAGKHFTRMLSTAAEPSFERWFGAIDASYGTDQNN